MKKTSSPIDASSLLGFRIDSQLTARGGEAGAIKTGMKKGGKPPSVGPAAEIPVPPAPGAKSVER